jgi:hypothetical protein
MVAQKFKSRTMKISHTIIFAVVAMCMIACSGSDAYRGAWKAMDADGFKYEITFDAKNFSIKDSTGKASSYNYSQNSVEIKNGAKNYGIQVSDGRGYKINFPKANDESIGLIKDENGNPIYTIGRNSYVNYNDIFKLN